MTSRVVISTLAGLFAVGIILLCVPRHPYLPKGMVLPAQVVRPASSPNQVVIYDHAPSGDFKRLADIHIEQAYTNLNDHTKALLFQKVKDMAASVGANGVIVTLLTQSNELRPMIVFYGAAIYRRQSALPATRSSQS